MVHPPKSQACDPVNLSLQKPQRTSKLISGVDSLQRIQNQASANVGAPLTSYKQKSQMESLQKLQTAFPMVAGPHQLLPINKRPGQIALPVKVQANFELVRSKLRESLAYALDSGSREQSKPRFLEKVSAGEEKCLLEQAEDSSVQNEIHLSATNGSICEGFPNYLNSNKQVKNFDGEKGLPSESVLIGNLDDKEAVDSICNVQEGNERHDTVIDAVPFRSFPVMEDELLQGHGLIWASDFDSVNADSIPNTASKRLKLMDVEENRDSIGTSLHTSEHLSFLIEEELFKLFGGVNKKYKEKGRSLLFNLKDPSNPDLRERVLSGEVSPERLCSMTAEELASEELSQWRQAKAEEFAQMVVLPDMNIDIRRLVRKTHKGEFQVEVEQDDGALSEVGFGSDVLSRMSAESNNADKHQPRSNDKGLIVSRVSDSMITDYLMHSGKYDSDGKNSSNILNHKLLEKADDVQNFMVSESKDTEHLPSVVSQNEFMQEPDSESHFKSIKDSNLQENLRTVDRNLDKVEYESIHVHGSSEHKTVCTPDISAGKLTSGNNLDSQLHSGGDSHTEHLNERTLWEGFLQLNASALSNVVSFYLSGERTSMLEWPSLLEVKGRVRLDAFEKFLQELPLSRSRTIMLAEFSWKEGSTDSGRAHLSEAIHSYVTDERLGFAEPAPGVELYFCPPHPNITGLPSFKELLEKIGRVVEGLIGIIVWRRPHSIISPKPSSHHQKHGASKKLSYSGSKRRHDSSKDHHSNSTPRRNPMPLPADEDDVPPGFGPPIYRDDDDLPEFDYSHGSCPPGMAHPPERARELIQKYGHCEGGGIPVQPWNDDEDYACDDDDDIPEWNPSQHIKQAPPSILVLPPQPHQQYEHQQQQQYQQQQQQQQQHQQYQQQQYQQQQQQHQHPQQQNVQPFAMNQNMMMPSMMSFMQAPLPPQALMQQQLHPMPNVMQQWWTADPGMAGGYVHSGMPQGFFMGSWRPDHSG